jgi:hypothetical protein
MHIAQCIALFAHMYSGAGILEQSIGARNLVGIVLSYRPARLHGLAELIPWNRFLGSFAAFTLGGGGGGGVVTGQDPQLWPKAKVNIGHMLQNSSVVSFICELES